jgi:hypothetical protein
MSYFSEFICGIWVALLGAFIFDLFIFNSLSTPYPPAQRSLSASCCCVGLPPQWLWNAMLFYFRESHGQWEM